MGKHIFSCVLVVRPGSSYSTNSLHLQSTEIKEPTIHSVSAAKEEAPFHERTILGKVHHEKLQQLIPIFSFARTPGRK